MSSFLNPSKLDEHGFYFSGPPPRRTTKSQSRPPLRPRFLLPCPRFLMTEFAPLIAGPSPCPCSSIELATCRHWRFAFGDLAFRVCRCASSSSHGILSPKRNGPEVLSEPFSNHPIKVGIQKSGLLQTYFSSNETPSESKMSIYFLKFVLESGSWTNGGGCCHESWSPGEGVGIPPPARK